MTQRRLVIGPELRLPADEAQTQTEVVYGGKGMGKTNFGTVYAEELFAHGLRFVWLDPVGVAWGMKHSADGRGPGLEVLVLGGRHGELPILPTGGAVVADLVVDEDTSVVIDISSDRNGRMWSVGERVRFVRDFCLRLYQRQGEQRRPLKLIIDEAGRFVPQVIPKGALDMAECVGAVEQLVELGRNVGVGVMLLTQRSARMNKSVSELAEMMVGFRTVGPRSIDAIVDWFGEHVPRESQKHYVERLRQLRRGTALVVSPGWLGIEGEFDVRARRTFDSSATPVAGTERRPRGKGAGVANLDHYRERMQETVEAASANDPAHLRRRVAELEAELRRSNAKPEERPADPVEVEVPVLTAEDRARLEGIVDEFHRRTGEVQAALDDLAKEVRVIGDGILSLPAPHVKGVPARRVPPPAAVPRPAPSRPGPAARRGAPAPSDNGAVTLKKGARRIVEVLARHYPMKVSRRQVATLAGLKASGGTFQTYWSAIVRAGLVEQSDGLVTVTASGLAYAGVDEPRPLTTEELLETWRRALKAGARTMLDILVEHYPEGMTRDELADAAGITASGGTFQTYLSTLRNNGLVDVDAATVRASETLFLG